VPKSNVHVHLFTADHSPAIQFFYLLWNVFENILVRKGVLCFRFELEELARNGWRVRLLLFLAEHIGFAGRMLDEPVRGLVRTVVTLSHLSEAQVRDVLHVKGWERPGHDAVAEIRKRLKTHRRERYPFDAVLASIARDLYALHESGQGLEPVTHGSLLRLFYDAGPTGGRAKFRRIVPLTVNFDKAFTTEKYGLALVPRKVFADQVAEMVELAQTPFGFTDGNQRVPVEVWPFLCVDPRYQPPNGLSLLAWVRSLVWPNGAFRGLKLYPPMGFEPNDPVLLEIFAWCKQNSIPVTAHCSIGGAGLRGLEKEQDYAHPDKWRDVLNELRERGSKGVFRLNLAHFSDLSRSLRTEADDTWSDEIIALMEEYNGRGESAGVEIYSDISYAWLGSDSEREKFGKNVAKLREKQLMPWVLFGSDWWNYLPDCTDEVEYAGNMGLADLFDEQQLDDNADWFLGVNGPGPRFAATARSERASVGSATATV